MISVAIGPVRAAGPDEREEKSYNLPPARR